MTFPLKFKVFKPRERLKEEDKYKTKPELGAELIKELKVIGFKIKRVLADSLYGESHSHFISIIEDLEIEYAVAIRSNHGVWLPKEAKVRANKWREFEHIKWDGKRETRYIREIIYGARRKIQYWEITRDKENIKPENIWFVMTKIPQIKYKQVGQIYGVRMWIEYGFKQSKSELGWADFKVTHYEQIQKWWELIMSAYLMICLHSEFFNPAVNSISEIFQRHELWETGKGWKSLLNNIQLILQPYVYFNLILKWLKIFPIPQLSLGFPRLIAKINEINYLHYSIYLWDDFCYSSA